MNQTHVRVAAAVLLALAAMLPIGQARAQQQIPPPVVMVIDTNRIMAEARAMKSIREQIDRIRSSFQAEIKRDEDELRRLDQEIAQQRQLLSAEAFNQRRQDLQQKAAALQVKARTRRSQLDQALRNAMQTVRATLVRIVENVARSNG